MEKGMKQEMSTSWGKGGEAEDEERSPFFDDAAAFPLHFISVMATSSAMGCIMGRLTAFLTLLLFHTSNLLLRVKESMHLPAAMSHSATVLSCDLLTCRR
jgi:hypothetical protein